MIHPLISSSELIAALQLLLDNKSSRILHITTKQHNSGFRKFPLLRERLVTNTSLRLELLLQNC